MLLKSYHEPTPEELQAAFVELHQFVARPGRFSWLERLFMALLYKKMGDRLLVSVAQTMHGSTIQTLHRVSHGMHDSWFKERRIAKKVQRAAAAGWVKSTVVE